MYPVQTTTQDEFCECPSDCNVTVHNAALSYAALSADGIGSLLSTHRKRIQGKYTNAREIKERVDPETLLRTLKMMQDIDVSMEEYRYHWEFKVYNKQTSVITRLETAIEKVIEMASKDINGLFRNVSQYVEFYDSNLIIARHWVGDMAARVVTGYSRIVMRLLSDWNTGVTTDHLEDYTKAHADFEDVLDNAIDIFKFYGDIPKVRALHYTAEFDLYTPSQTVTNKTLGDACSYRTIHARVEALRGELRSIMDALPDIAGTNPSGTLGSHLSQIYTNKDHFEETILSMDREWRSFSADIEKCVNEYRNFLGDVLIWQEETAPLYTAV